MEPFRSELVVDIADVLAIAIRNPAIIVYNNAVPATKIASRLDLMQRYTKLETLNAERVAHVLGGIARSVPDNPTHRRSCLALGQGRTRIYLPLATASAICRARTSILGENKARMNHPAKPS